MTNNTNIIHDTKALTRTGLVLLSICFLEEGQAFADGTHPTMKSTPTEQYDKDSCGYLNVFSTTQESQWGEGSHYYLHTGYRIDDSSGKVVKWVVNHSDNADEAPERVELAPGTYNIWAQSDKAGYVKVSVAVKPGQLTAIHLEKDEAGNKATNPVKLVKTTSGQVVGWRD